MLKPREGTALKRKFSTIDVWVDPATNMPVKIETVTTSRRR
jgi:outer membrane lipoprotein-sorting protein